MVYDQTVCGAAFGVALVVCVDRRHELRAARPAGLVAKRCAKGLHDEVR